MKKIADYVRAACGPYRVELEDCTEIKGKNIAMCDTTIFRAL